MSFPNLMQYVYQTSDFLTAGGNVIPPNEQGGTAAGAPPYAMTLLKEAQTRPIVILDDDTNFEEFDVGDGEVGGTGRQELATGVTMNGTFYPAGTSVIINFSMTTADGFVGYSVTLGGTNTNFNPTTVFITTQPMIPGQQYVFTQAENTAGTGGIPYAEFACFVAGAMILTPNGPMKVEKLAVGDLVNTRDHGPQPIRWIGQRLVPGVGKLAPVRIAAGTLGATADLELSPNHRVLVEGGAASLFTGEDGVLVAIKHLLNGRTVRRLPRGFVTYYHFMFDKHDIVEANGCAVESFLVGGQLSDLLDPDQLAELTALFPELAGGTQPPSSRICRPEATGREVRVFAQSM